jgi:hypothetical protein
MRGGSAAGGSYLIASTPSVQLSFRLAISVEEFFGPALVQNIATLLQVCGARGPMALHHGLCCFW